MYSSMEGRERRHAGPAAPRPRKAGNDGLAAPGFVLLAAILLAPAGCGNGEGKEDSDSETDTEAGDPEEVEPSDADGQTELLPDSEDDVLADEEEEEVETWHRCGNGIIEGPEVCDDGNRETEYCGRWDDCLGDCSLLQADCGNGILDDGEECDDGNTDNLDFCTISCNINDHGIGAPCECPSCYGIHVTGEDIAGCEGVEVPPDSGGELACVHTVLEEYSGYMFHGAGGYCTIYALDCVGGETECAEVEEIGDVETFSCPPGHPHFGARCEGPGGIGIVLKACMRPCDYPSQCRWNAYDEELGECGQMGCIVNEANPDADPPERVCFDERNFELDLPGLECEFVE